MHQHFLYMNIKGCLDHFSVDDDLSRRTLADLHRLLVKADVGVRKVVFEGVHLMGDWKDYQLFSDFLPRMYGTTYHVVDRDEGIVNDLNVEAGLERRPQDEPPDLLEAVDADLWREDLARQILLL